MSKKDIIKIDHRLDITKEICPMTFVKTKLKLETMNTGEILEVTLREGEPLRNVPKSVNEDGHKILSINQNNQYYMILIEKS